MFWGEKKIQFLNFEFSISNFQNLDVILNFEN